MNVNPTKLKLFIASLCAAAGVATVPTASAQSLHRVRHVFYIYMENHNWTQPNGNVDTAPTSGIEQIKGNPAAPFINGLVDPHSPFSADVAYTNNCFNPLATPDGTGPSIHPSEPNYLWTEAGSNYGTTNDADPYQNTKDPNGNVFDQPSIAGLLQAAGLSWTSYQEGIDLVPAAGAVNQPAAGALTNAVAPENAWTVPLRSFNGVSTGYTNPYNGSNQYNYAAKHNPQLFFAATNGGTLTTPDFGTSNPEVRHYRPLEVLARDLERNRVARYNVITPDQFNDMHNELTGGFTYNGVHYTGDAAHIAQGDNFLRTIVPMIMASQAYQHDGLIVIWNDETERQDSSDTTPNDYHHSCMEILISPLTKGHAYHNDALTYTHSSDVETLQEIFPIGPAQGVPFIGQTTSDTAGNRDYSDMFVASHDRGTPGGSDDSGESDN